MEKNLKIYVLILSEYFPVSHPKAGQPTGFADALQANLQRLVCHEQRQCVGCGECVRQLKYHTIRRNADLWEKRAAEINAGRAVLSIRQWSGKPYGKGTHQREIARLTHLGTQRITMPYETYDDLGLRFPVSAAVQESCSLRPVELTKLAANDGLSMFDFMQWFSIRKKGPVSDFEGVILHFTDLRY